MEIKIPDAIAAACLGTLALNFSLANWNLNPLWDLVYARVQGPFLFGNHAVIGLLAVGIGFYLSWRNGKILFSMITIFAVIGLHECIAQVLSIFLYGWQLVAPQMFTNYDFILWGCIATFIGFSNIKQKKAFGVTTIVIFSYFCTMFSIYYLQDFRPITLERYSAGPQYWNLEANLVEVVGWIAALLTQATMMARFDKESLANKNVFNPLSPIVTDELRNGFSSPQGNQKS